MIVHCPYERARLKPADGENAQCRILCVASGFIISNDGPTCAACIAGQFWNRAAVPQLKPDAPERDPKTEEAAALVTGCLFFARLYKQSLRARLIAGDCPRYQDENPVDLTAAFGKFRTATNDAKAQDLLANMLDAQIQKAKTGAEDVDDEATVRDKIATLAEANGFITASEAMQLRSAK